MKKKLVSLIPYAVALIAIFYVLPLSVHSTGLAMLTMLLIIPLLTLLCAVVYGRLHGFGLLFPLAAAVLFAPSILIFYNASAWVYIVIYAVVALAGVTVGSVLRRKSGK